MNIQEKINEIIVKNGGGIPEMANLYNRTPINSGIVGTITTNVGNPSAIGSTILMNKRIRTLTPRECFRLMGVKDTEFERICYGKPLPEGSLDKLHSRTMSRSEWKEYWRIARNQKQSNISLYHLAGDSIVINVLEAIFKQML